MGSHFAALIGIVMLPSIGTIELLFDLDLRYGEWRGVTAGLWGLSWWFEGLLENRAESSGIQYSWWSGLFLEVGGGFFFLGLVAVVRQFGGYRILGASEETGREGSQSGRLSNPPTWETHGRQDVETALLRDRQILTRSKVGK